jgi:hypothetical protein
MKYFNGRADSVFPSQVNHGQTNANGLEPKYNLAQFLLSNQENLNVNRIYFFQLNTMTPTQPR